MLHTRFCDLFDVEVPVLQAAIWPATSPELVAAVCEAGALGSIGAVFTPAERLQAQIDEVRRLTARPFVVNHVVPVLDEEAFAATLEARPAGVSFALGSPRELVDRAHAAGCRVIHQVHTVSQAREAAALGADVIIAQGAEAGGQGMLAGIGAMALVPQVVDAVDPLPVLAAGGVADGRGFAAALVLGAQGVNVGTRFVASDEASADDAWKSSIARAQAEDVVRFEAWQAIFPPPGGDAFDVVPRVIRTDFVQRWRSSADAEREAERLRDEVMGAVQRRRPQDILPFTGQTAGLIHDIRPAGEIVTAIIAEAERALTPATGLIA